MIQWRQLKGRHTVSRCHTERGSLDSLYLSGSVLARKLSSQKGPVEVFSAFVEAAVAQGLSREGWR